MDNHRPLTRHTRQLHMFSANLGEKCLPERAFLLQLVEQLLLGGCSCIAPLASLKHNPLVTRICWTLVARVAPVCHLHTAKRTYGHALPFWWIRS